MKKSTIWFFVLVGLLLLNLIFSLTLTFSVPLESADNPLQYMGENMKAELSLFGITGVLIIVLDLYLLFAFPESIQLLPPFTLGAIFGFFGPFLFLSLYFVKRPTQTSPDQAYVNFFSLIPLTFVTVIFYLFMALFNAIVENIKAAKQKRIKP
jgi:hypothetical protein